MSTSTSDTEDTETFPPQPILKDRFENQNIMTEQEGQKEDTTEDTLDDNSKNPLDDIDYVVCMSNSVYNL